MSIQKGNILRNSSCIIQINAYYNSVTNIAKKLAEIFQSYINTFLSTISSIIHSKVINFAIYEQDVNEVRQ